jgi:hypothetical protein
MRSLVFSMALLALGCESNERVDPAPRDEPGSAVSSSSTSGGGTPRVVKRRVSWRSTVGKPSGNLLVDGDFEFSIVIEGYGGQSGWLAFGSGPAGYLAGQTGGRCRSGLRCGIMRPGMVLFGRGVAAKDSGMLAAFYSQPPEGSPCAVIQPTLIHCDFQGLALPLAPETELPAEDGWCRYSAGVEQQPQGVCMYVDSSLESGQTALVDAATVLPSNGTVPLAKKGDARQGALQPMQKVAAERAQAMRAISTKARNMLPLGRAKKALQVAN